jgi:hypothetical protein
MGVQAFKEFDGFCPCGATEIQLFNTSKIGEHFFAQILYAIVTRNMATPEGSDTSSKAHLVYDPAITHATQCRVRCDGTIFVGKGYDGGTVNYNLACMSLVRSLISSYIITHPDSRYIRTIERFTISGMSEMPMRDAITLLELYVKATSCDL